MDVGTRTGVLIRSLELGTSRKDGHDDETGKQFHGCPPRFGPALSAAMANDLPLLGKFTQRQGRQPFLATANWFKHLLRTFAKPYSYDVCASIAYRRQPLSLDVCAAARPCRSRTRKLWFLHSGFIFH
ncbi:protein of unknown function [Paraburkholderia kururiensis]